VENKKSIEEEKRKTVKHKGNWTRKKKEQIRKPIKRLIFPAKSTSVLYKTPPFLSGDLKMKRKGFPCGLPPPH